jgi:hypothetical protein
MILIVVNMNTVEQFVTFFYIYPCLALVKSWLHLNDATPAPRHWKKSPDIPYVQRCAFKQKLEAEPPEPHQNFN